MFVKTMEHIFGEDAKKKMPLDIEEQIVRKVKNSLYFAAQCDESTDVAHCCQLLVFVEFYFFVKTACSKKNCNFHKNLKLHQKERML